MADGTCLALTSGAMNPVLTSATSAIPGAGARGNLAFGPADAALGVGGFAIGTGEFVIMGLLPEVARDLPVTIPQAGHVISAYALGVVIGAPLLAVLAARWRRATCRSTCCALRPACRPAPTSAWRRWRPPRSRRRIGAPAPSASSCSA